MTHSKAALATYLVLLLSLGVGCRQATTSPPVSERELSADKVAKQIAKAKPPRVSLVRTDGDAKITDLLPAAERKLETVTNAVKTETARPSLIVSGTEATFVGPDGRPVKKVQPPPDLIIPGYTIGVLSFGNCLVYYLSSLHQPGAPYDLVMTSATSAKRLRRAAIIGGLSVLSDPESGAQYLAVKSVDSVKRVPVGTWRTEVFRDDGEIEWQFRDERPSAVAVRGDRAVAVYPGRPRSIVRTANRKTGHVANLAVPNAVLNSAAFLSDGSAIVLWGNHDTALVDVEGKHVLWTTILDHRGGTGEYPKQLGSSGGVSVVGGTLSMVARKRVDYKDRWQVRLYSFDVKTGVAVGMVPLFEQKGQVGITFMSRSAEDERERISIGHREYELRARASGSGADIPPNQRIERDK